MRFNVGVIGLVMLLMIASCSGKRITTTDSFDVVELPDGSTIYLNKNSSVRFDEDFSKRLVHAEGEVYFEVEENGSPFIVSTSIGEIEVTGTAFSVSTREESLEVEVEDGSVIIRTDEIEQAVKAGSRAVVSFGKELVAEGKAEFKSNKWMRELRREFKKAGKEIGRESKKAAKSLKKELKDLN